MRTIYCVNYGGMSESSLSYVRTLAAALNADWAEASRLIRGLWPDAALKYTPAPDCPDCLGAGLECVGRVQRLSEARGEMVGEHDDYTVCGCVIYGGVVASQIAGAKVKAAAQIVAAEHDHAEMIH